MGCKISSCPRYTIYLTEQLEQAETKAQSPQWTFSNVQNCGNSRLPSLAEAALLPETTKDDTTQNTNMILI